MSSGTLAWRVFTRFLVSGKGNPRPFAVYAMVFFAFLFFAFFATRRGGGPQVLLEEACDLLESANWTEVPDVCLDPSSAPVASSSETGIVAGVLSVSVTNERQLNITVSSEHFSAFLPTPLGSFGPYHSETMTFGPGPTPPIVTGDAPVDPEEIFPEHRTLTVYAGPQQWVYDLGRHAFDITIKGVEAQIRNDPETGNLAITILEDVQHKPPTLHNEQVEQEVSRQATGTSDCGLTSGSAIHVTKNARTWPLPNVTDSMYTSTLPTEPSYYVLNGPVWGAIRWDTDHEGWWWEVSSTEDGDSLGWIWEGRIVECY